MRRRCSRSPCGITRPGSCRGRELYREVLAIDRSHFGSLHHLGIMALQRGQPHAAVDLIGRAIAIDDRIPDCHYNMAFALQSVGRLNEAVGHYSEAVRLKPDYVEAHTNLGNVLRELGRHDDAVAVYERVIGLEPSAEAHYNLANMLARSAGWTRRSPTIGARSRSSPTWSGAQQSRQCAGGTGPIGRGADPLPARARTRSEPGRGARQPRHYAAAAGKAGRGCGGPGARAEHQSRFRRCPFQPRQRAAGARPPRASGAVLPACARAQARPRRSAQQSRDRAPVTRPVRGGERAFQRALARKPDFIDAYNNLARAFMALGQPDHALGALRRALAIAETAETKSLFVQCVKMLAVPPSVEDFRALMIRALSEPWGRANDLAPVAARLVSQDDTIRGAFERAVDAWPRRLAPDELLGPSGLAAIAGDRLLRCLLESATIADVELERFLTALRPALLGLVSGGNAPIDDAVRDLCCALARQCFLNEQVFACDEEEIALARSSAMRSWRRWHRMAQSPSLGWQWLPATFRSMRCRARSGCSSGNGLRRSPTCSSSRWASPPRSAGCAHRYRCSPRSRTTYRARSSSNTRKIPIRAGRRRTRRESRSASISTCAGDCRRHFRPWAERGPTSWSPAAAPASMRSRRRSGLPAPACWRSISASPASPMRRKTRELGAHNIEYAPGRHPRARLDRPQLRPHRGVRRAAPSGRSAGRLAHPAVAAAAGRRYARSASTARSRAPTSSRRGPFIAERGYRRPPTDIRRCRQDLLTVDGGNRFRNVAVSDDFFSTSECRDLLFHVQEHRLHAPADRRLSRGPRSRVHRLRYRAVDDPQVPARFPHDIA